VAPRQALDAANKRGAGRKSGPSNRGQLKRRGDRELAMQEELHTAGPSRD
jgi:hypothetical protein